MKFEKVIQLNKQFEINNNNGLEDLNNSNKNHFIIKKGKGDIVISAPHSVNHLREGELINADLLTGGLTLYLSEKYNLPCIYSTSYLVGDPNYDGIEKCLYKEKLSEYIKENNINFLIDLHGCRSERNFAIELGTGGGNHPNLQGNEKLLNIIKGSLNDSLGSYLLHTGREITINTLFSASNNNTISRYIFAKNHIPTIQLEINYELRNPMDEDKITKLITALENLIEDLEKFFKNKVL